MISLKEKTAVITGSARGIGRAIAEKLAAAGSKIVISDIMEDEGKKTAAEIKEKYGVETLFIASNVADRASADNLVEEAFKAFGRIDTFVNNAGITRDTLLLRMKEDDFDRVISVNLKGTFNCSQSVLKKMIKQYIGLLKKYILFYLLCNMQKYYLFQQRQDKDL